MAAAGTAVSALQANAQARYQAKIAERNAAMEREAAQVEIQAGKDASLAHYRKVGQLKGQQRVAAAANGVSLDFGTAADLMADTEMMSREDVRRLYQDNTNKLRGRDITVSNYLGEASAQKQAGKGALIKGAFDFGSTILGGASQYKKLRAG